MNYGALRKIWQYEYLSVLRAVMPRNAENAKLIDRLFHAHGKGFYVHAEPRGEDGVGISRYICHPAIANARIVAYDGESVTFFYQDHEGLRHEPTCPTLTFIHGVVRHIPPKQFKMVRYFGLYAPRKAAQVQAILQPIGQMLGRVVQHLNWRQRIERDFGRDPLQCPRCGETDMELYSLTIRWRGHFKTIGGLHWLFKQGILRETAVALPPRPASPSKPSVYQLALGL